MSKSTVTYLKREYKKVLPVFILACLYICYIFVNIYLKLNNRNLEVLLSFAYAEEYDYFQLGNLLLGSLGEVMEEIHLIFVIIFEFLLLQRVFYQENRAGVSDFLCMLPIREKNKVAMKVLAGESVIFGFCTLFGVMGSLTNALLDSQIREAVSFFPGAGATVNSYSAIWQISLLMFLGLSTMFLVLFVARLCVHNQVLATIVGAGFLFVPIYYSQIYTIITGADRKIMEVALSILYPLPRTGLNAVSSSEYADSISQYAANWDYYPDKVIFLLVLVGIALALLIFTLYRRWNIRESNNVLINSPGVAEFIVCGFSFSVGLGWNFMDGMYSYSMTGREFVAFFISSFIVAAIVWAIIHGVGFGIMKRQKGA